MVSQEMIRTKCNNCGKYQVRYSKTGKEVLGLHQPKQGECSDYTIVERFNA